MNDDLRGAFRTLEDFRLADADAVWTILHGDSVIDWKRLNFTTRDDVHEFLCAQEFDPEVPSDRARLEWVKSESVAYLRRTFEYVIPKRLAARSVPELILLASGHGVHQLPACVILKVMHIIHHLQGRELLYVLPLSDAEVFRMVEEKVYRVIGGMMSAGLPIREFLGGRKNRDSLYTKLLSKTETIAAQIYDKLRFRIVCSTADDVIPVMNFLSRRLFPFNYAIPGESTNTLLNPRIVAQRAPRLQGLLSSPDANARVQPTSTTLDNKFSSRKYRVIHFVVDLPVRVSDEVLGKAPAAATLGPVVFVLTEFQLVDEATESANETGEASHARYKDRQRQAVFERLCLGQVQAPPRPTTPPPPPAKHRTKP